MTVSEILGWVTTLMQELGLMTPITAFFVILLAITFIRKIFER